ncbi:succinoglycan biosynthesis protein ExoM [Methyloglobulus morosus KoM1]|uniref:Succinoglycan biosynthesis protein ExoM n=1 Tax=Methyloglobulus morosus KoM1 TaxID=1116472 RepID=V5E3G0_9GAMM|nr:glycosyltransferase [Methyloglobulus morosus]ESS74091.1 succinoglycan biosynthesis protein ExoM [Methyloglobulus morosus KoM1]
MPIEIINIDICIATYKRVDLLKKLLESLVVQILDESIKIRIIIIDNDPNASAQSIVNAFFAKKDLPYIYDTQPEKNIAITRNKALDYTDANFLAFIDDDEWATPDWLNNLLLASTQYDADVVFGPVMPQFSEVAPDWISKGGFFNRNASKSGDIKTHGATNNTLIRNPEKFKAIFRFDPEYGLTGGEDTDLFHRLYLNGAKLVWNDAALVYEVIPPERMTVNWLVKRALRGGQIYAKVYLREFSLTQKTIWFFKRINYLCLSVLLLPVTFFMGKHRWVWVLLKITANFGQLNMVFTNKAYQEYK